MTDQRIGLRVPLKSTVGNYTVKDGEYCLKSFSKKTRDLLLSLESTYSSSPPEIGWDETP